MYRNKRRKRNAGLTLIELVIAITIMTILVGITAPVYVKYVDKSKKSKDIYTADQIARAVNIAFVENPEAYEKFCSWTGLSANVKAVSDGNVDNYKVFLIAANEAPEYCFKGGESNFGDKKGNTGFYGVINRELGLETSGVNVEMIPKHRVNGVSPKNTEKYADRWRICKRSDNGQLEIWVAQPDPWGGYPAYRLWPIPDDEYK